MHQTFINWKPEFVFTFCIYCWEEKKTYKIYQKTTNQPNYQVEKSYLRFLNKIINIMFKICFKKFQEPRPPSTPLDHLAEIKVLVSTYVYEHRSLAPKNIVLFYVKCKIIISNINSR